MQVCQWMEELGGRLEVVRDALRESENGSCQRQAEEEI